MVRKTELIDFYLVEKNKIKLKNNYKSLNVIQHANRDFYTLALSTDYSVKWRNVDMYVKLADDCTIRRN